jgi:hypothetical protein
MVARPFGQGMVTPPSVDRAELSLSRHTEVTDRAAKGMELPNLQFPHPDEITKQIGEMTR